MLRKISVFTFFLAIIAQVSWAQDAKISGKVFDLEGNPLPFATVLVFDGETVRYGTQSDQAGFFSIQPVDAGNYQIQARYTGDATDRIDILVVAGQTRLIDLRFRKEVGISTLDEVVIEAGNPVFERDPKVNTTMTQEDILNMGTRSVTSIAATTAGIYQGDEGDFGIQIRGARAEATVYYIDGIKVRGTPNLPQSSISQLQAIVGGHPAEFGDFTGGVISITTANPASTLSGGLELVSSRYLDPYDRNLAGLTLSGPLITKKQTIEGTDATFKRAVLGFFLAGELDYQGDSDPAALGIYRLKPGLLEDLQANPVEISPDGQTFRSRANFIRTSDLENVRAKSYNADFRYRGSARIDFQPSNNILVKVGGNFERSNIDQWGIGNMIFAPEGGDKFTGGSYRGWFRFQQSFPGSEDSPIKNLFYSLQADYSIYQRRFQNNLHRENFFDYGYYGKFDFDVVPIYQYVDNPLGDGPSSPYWRTVAYGFNNLRYDPNGSKNTVQVNHNQAMFDYVAQNGVNNLFPGLFTSDPIVYNYTNLNEFAFRQGMTNGRGVGNVYSIFSGLGSQVGTYTKFDFEQYRLSGQATAEIKGHNIKTGFEFEQRVERFYSLFARGLYPTMRSRANFHLNSLESNPALFEYVVRGGEFQDTINVPLAYSASDQSFFDKQLRQKLGLPIDGTDLINVDAYGPDFYSLDMFSADELLNNGLGIVNYYGYDYKGNRMARTDPGGFLTDQTNRPENPYAPTYISAFIQDKFEFEDIIFNIGVRVDRFDANQLVLRDPFSLYPIFSASETAQQLGTSLPGSVGGDWVAYVDDANNPSEILGYRNGESWYNASGAPVSSTSIAQISGGRPKPHVKGDGSVGVESFEDYTPQTTFMPRISFSFPISDEALFFAHYDVLTQRPGQLLATQGSLLAGQVSQYAFLENQPTATVSNPNLKPEVTIDYEAGFKQKLGDRMALTVSAFYREMRNMIRFRRFTNAYPFSYDTYDNLDFGTVKGFSFQYDMRRTGNVQLRGAYTLQFADATGSDFSSARAVVNFLEGVGILRVPLPINNDQRHRLSGVIDYRFGGRNRGPAINLGSKTLYPLDNFGTNLTLQLGSGTPFSKNSVVVPAVASGINIVNQLQGTPNGSRRPWQFRADLRVDKSFSIGGKTLEGGKKSRLYDINVYVLLLNALDTRNVVSVYRFTGLPDDDGWLQSDQGIQTTFTQIDPASYVDLYSIRVQNPNNYSIPRRMQLGMFFNF